MKKLMAILAVAIIVAFAAPALAATNPFMDVPAGHWAYDAVAQLASRGIASGYPDGSYKGAQPATRYEMASMVARALTQIDMEKASKQDVELLKRLVLEFKNELDALGVKVSDLDKRVAVLEDGIGGWKIRGIFRFDAKFGDSDNDNYTYNNNNLKNEFDKERFRLFLTKQVNENTTFYAQYRTGSNGAGNSDGRGDLQHMRWADLYVDTKLPWDLSLRVGRFLVDFEDDYDLYIDNDGLFGDFRIDGFRFIKDFGMLTATAIVGRNSYLDNATVTRWSLGSDGTPTSTDVTEEGTTMSYILDLHFQPSESFFIGATGYWTVEDSATNIGDWDIDTYGFYAGYSFTPHIALKGIYYFQDFGDNILGANFDDSPQAWRVAIDVKQEALKFTSLWIEYMNMDNTFFTDTHPIYSIGCDYAANVLHNQPVNADTTKVLFVKAGQKWNEKWGSWLRFAWADLDTTGYDDAYEYGVGVTYQLNPGVQFELAYDLVDYGSNTFGTNDVNKNGRDFLNDKESVVRFRTTVSF